ncbi:hypothetical protein P2W50_31265 [Pseudomonas protegens]|uniref:hypothetical protein n=1 Tax=Pseudomonas protegens TaxID=380021 RepID=UPI0023EB05EE|nr:hypothetical protein [Pseudomonas protegens]MDF4211133.1 hypothetical protein [Pseudomonas protegens]
MSSSIARIHVNGVEVGSLPLETYQSIVSGVKKDRRLHLALAYGFVGGVIRVLLAGLRHAPWIAGALIGLFAVASPETFAQFLVELKAADPADITRFIGVSAKAAFWMASFGSVFIVMIKAGFRNPIDEAISLKIRTALEVPAEGRIRVQVVEAPTSAE